MLKAFEDDLKQLGFHEAVRATCFGISISMPIFDAILEMYYPVSRAFFTPVGELGMALHEMWEVSNLPMCSLPYEECFLCAEQLEQLEKKESVLHETYRELMCYFYICLDLHPSHESTNGLKTWVDYLFLVVDGPLESLQAAMEDRQIARAMKASENGDIVFEEDDDEHKKGNTFLGFHRQAGRSLSRRDLLAGYLSAGGKDA